MFHRHSRFMCVVLACALALQHLPALASPSLSAVRQRATRQTPPVLAAVSQALIASHPADVVPAVAPHPIPFSRTRASSSSAAWFRRAALIFLAIDLAAPFLYASTVESNADVFMSGVKALWPALMVALAIHWAFPTTRVTGMRLAMPTPSFEARAHRLRQDAKTYASIWPRRWNLGSNEKELRPSQRYAAHWIPDPSFFDDGRLVRGEAVRYQASGLTIYDLAASSVLWLREPKDGEVIATAWDSLCYDCAEVAFVGNQRGRRIIGAAHHMKAWLEPYHKSLPTYLRRLRRTYGIAVEHIVVGHWDTQTNRKATVELRNQLVRLGVALTVWPRSTETAGIMVVTREGAARLLARPKLSPATGKKRAKLEKTPDVVILWDRSVRPTDRAADRDAVPRSEQRNRNAIRRLLRPRPTGVLIAVGLAAWRFSAATAMAADGVNAVSATSSSLSPWWWVGGIGGVVLPLVAVLFAQHGTSGAGGPDADAVGAGVRAARAVDGEI